MEYQPDPLEVVIALRARVLQTTRTLQLARLQPERWPPHRVLRLQDALDLDRSAATLIGTAYDITLEGWPDA